MPKTSSVLHPKMNLKSLEGFHESHKWTATHAYFFSFCFEDLISLSPFLFPEFSELLDVVQKLSRRVMAKGNILWWVFSHKAMKTITKTCNISSQFRSSSFVLQCAPWTRPCSKLTSSRKKLTRSSKKIKIEVWNGLDQY